MECEKVYLGLYHGGWRDEVDDAMILFCELSGIESEVLVELGTSLHWRVGKVSRCRHPTSKHTSLIEIP